MTVALTDLIIMLRKVCRFKLQSSTGMTVMSIITIFVLVLATLVVATVLSRLPLIVAAIAQAKSGQVDLVVTNANNRRMNRTKV